LLFLTIAFAQVDFFLNWINDFFSFADADIRSALLMFFDLLMVVTLSNAILNAILLTPSISGLQGNGRAQACPYRVRPGLQHEVGGMSLRDRTFLPHLRHFD